MNSERLQHELLNGIAMGNGLEENPLSGMCASRNESGKMRRGGRSGGKMSLGGAK